MSILNIILLIIGIYFIVSAFSENHKMSKGFVVFSGFYCIIYALLNIGNTFNIEITMIG